MNDDYFGGSEDAGIGTTNKYSFGNKDRDFRYERVQELYVKCAQVLSEEMVEGFWEQKSDKDGNVSSTYHPDNRLKVKEAVLTFVSIMRGDIKDTNYEKEIDRILMEMEEYYNTILKNQISWWESMSYDEQKIYKQENPSFIPNLLNANSPYYHKYLNDCVEGYRLIFEQLELCLKDGAYFKRQKLRAGASS